MTAQAQQPTPALFFETITAYQRSEAIKSAIELDLFTAIGEGNHTASQIVARCQASDRGARILCDYLTMIGFLTKAGNSYGLTQDSTVFLDRRSPAFMGGAIEFILSDHIIEGFRHLTESVRKGGTVTTGTLAPEHPVWIKFARAMAPMMRPVAQGIAQLIDPEANRKIKILDIAASHGAFGLAFATRNPHAEIVGVDWANVLKLSMENAKAAGVADRHSTIAGSAFEVDYGTGYDVVLLTNFLHHLDCRTFPEARGAASRRSTPSDIARRKGCLTPEFDEMFKTAGFAKNDLHRFQPRFRS